jgi:predicted 2-oxoglutarate/Fe(II)-dependent dioxygenase YbiX
VVPGVIELRRVVSAERCASLRVRLDALGWNPTGQAYPDGYRNNDRIVFDDPALATEILHAIAAVLPQRIETHGGIWALDGLNSRFRACRYRNGQRFCVHRDGPWAESPERRTFLTVQVYLDDSFVGGATRFYDEAKRPLETIVPARGTAIVFRHDTWHDGEAVTSGTKHVLRTDVAYRLVTGGSAKAGHDGYAWCLAEHDFGLASGGRDGTIRRWALDGAPLERTQVAGGSVTALASLGRTLAYGTRSGVVGTLDGGSWARLRTAVVALRGCGRGVVAAAADGCIHFISPSSHRAVTAHRGWVWAVHVLPQGVISGGDDGRVLLHGGEAREVAVFDHSVRSVSGALDRLVVGDASGAIHVIGPDRVQSVRPHASAVTSVAVTADRVLSASEDGRVLLHSAGGATLLHAGDDFVREVVALKNGGVAWTGYDGRVHATSSEEIAHQVKKSGACVSGSCDGVAFTSSPTRFPRVLNSSSGR